MLLERDIQFASFLAGACGLLADPGVFDNEEADTEHDQVQVSDISAERRESERLQIRYADGDDRYVPWDFGKTKYSAK